MGTGWRRAFCTTIPKDNNDSDNHARLSDDTSSPAPTPSCVKLGIFSTRPQSADNTPTLRCKTTIASKSKHIKSTPSSPRSPFNLLRTALRIPKSGCGVCLQSVKTGQGMAIYTAECSHSFHFPCITQLVRKQGIMVCPVCNTAWNDVPLLYPIPKTHPLPPQNDTVEKTILQDDHKIQSSISAVRTRPLDDPVKPFNDDEPLASPTASAARFNPIPEADDEDNEDAAEFQGFFVDHPRGSKRGQQRNVEVKLLPEAAVVTVGRSHETFAVAVRVKAPAMEVAGTNRAPVDLVTVLDATEAKLEMTKRAMRLVISSLGPSDRLSIVAFPANRLLPLRRMTPQGQRLARRVVDRLAAGGAGAAMKIAAKVLEDRREKNPVASVILLSDGPDQTNTANQRLKNSHVSGPRFGHVQIPVSADAVADAFAKRVGGLLSVVVQDVRIQLGFSSGSAPGEIAAVYSCNGRPSLMRPDSIRLGDLYAEEERELLVELRVPTSVTGSHHVMSVRCGYRDPVTGETMQARERALLVPRPHAVRSSDPRIERMRSLFLATRAVAETRRLMERGEIGGAQNLLVGARMLLAESRSAEEYVRWLDSELAALQWRKQVVAKKVDPQRRRRMGEQHVAFVDENGEPLTPTSAWRAAEQLAKVAMMKKSLNRDLHGFENARF